MIIVKRTDKIIMAIHEDVMFMFDKIALEVVKRVAKPSGCVVGVMINSAYQHKSIMGTSSYHDMILEATECEIITKERLARLEDTDAKMDALEAGGVDNWDWYGESLKEYWAAKEEADNG